MLMNGNFVTRRVVIPQKSSDEPWSLSPLRLRAKGILKRSMPDPSNASTAGRIVRVAPNATMTTSMAPMPSERKNAAGTINIPQRATTTVTPLNSTVRPAVSPARMTASSLPRPRTQLLSESRYDHEGIVDPYRQTYHAHHHRDKEDQLKNLTEHCDQSQRHDNRHDRKPDR